MDTVFTVVSWSEAHKGFIRHLKAVRAAKTALFYQSRNNALCRWAEEQNLPLDRFGKRHLDDFLATRSEQGISSTTLHHDARSAKVFMKWCVKNDILHRNPLAEYQTMSAPKPYKYMPSENDMRALLAAAVDFWTPSKHPQSRFIPAAKRSFHAEKNYAIILTLLDSACRINEVLSMKLDDFQGDQLQIRTSKGREPRVVPVSKGCTEAVQGWLKVRARIMRDTPKEEDEGWLFISETGSKLDPGRFNKTLHRMTEFAGLTDSITLHSLRRYSLNRLSKHNLLMAQAIAGHKDPRTTLLYTELDPEFVRAMHEQAGVVRGLMVSTRTIKRKRLL